MKKFEALFLDRDGVINIDYGHVGFWKDFHYTENFLKAITILKNYSEKIIVVTNQAGIAKGKYTVSDFENLTKMMVNDLLAKGVVIDEVYYCPHHPNGSILEFAKLCDCRKPSSGMFLKAISDHGLNPKNCLMVGDNISDITAANAAGIEDAYLICADGTRQVGTRFEVSAVINNLYELALSLKNTFQRSRYK